MSQQWRTVGPDGGDVRSLAFDPHNPDRVFLGTSASRLYLSTDGGTNWSRYAQLGAATEMALDHIVFDPADSSIMYVAAWSVQSPHSDGDLFRSRDAGRTWQVLPAMHGKSIRALALAPSDPRILVAGALDGVFRSRDRGDHWERISPAEHREIKNVESIAVDPVNPAVIYAGTWHLPWKTDDGGKSWHSIKTGVIDDSDVFAIVIHPASPTVVYMSACSGIYKSTTGGQTFRKVQGIPYSARRTRALRMDPNDASILYAGTTEGLWKSSDSGATWKRMTPASTIVNDVLVDPRRRQRVLLATDRGGVLASDDGGANFAASNHGFTHRRVAALLVDRTDASVMYAGLLNDKEFGGVYVSRDSGANWTQISDGLDGRDVFVLRQSYDGAVIAGTNRGVFRLKPNQLKLDQLKPPDSQWEPLNCLQSNPLQSDPPQSNAATGNKATTSVTELTASVHGLELASGQWYAATSVGLLVSVDLGQSWHNVAAVSDLISVSAEGRIVAAASHQRLVISADKGESWLVLGSPQVAGTIHSIAVDSRGSIWLAASEGAFRSQDSGDSWQRVDDLPLVNVISIQFDPGSHRILAVGADSSTIFASANNGRTWNPIESGWLVHDLHTAHGNLVAATTFDGVVVQPAVTERAAEGPRTGSQ